MTTIQLNDPLIDQIARQKGIEFLTNDILLYLKTKFTTHNESLLLDSLDQKIKSSKSSNSARANRVKSAIEGLNSLIDNEDKKMLHQVYQDVLEGKANLTPYMDGMDALEQMIDEIENDNHQR